MRSVYVTQKGATVRREGGILQVFVQKDKVADVSSHDLGQLVLMGNIMVTPAALNLLLDRGVDVVYLSSTGRFRGRFVHGLSSHVRLRLSQYRQFDKAEFALALARSIVDGKMRNQRTFLMKFSRRYGATEDLSAAIRALKASIARVRLARDLDRVRGTEGAASAAYFRGFKGLIRVEGFRFDGRSRRPPLDPVNALLSLGYTLLFNAVEAAVAIVGLDPYLGSLHAVSAGRPSLVCDLVEEYRVPVVDSLVVALVNRRAVTVDDFEDAGPGEPVVVKREAVARFVHALEARLETSVMYEPQGRALTYRQVVEQQTRHLARVILNEDAVYVPFTVK